MRTFVYVLIPLEREHCDKMARFEPFSKMKVFTSLGAYVLSIEGAKFYGL